MSQVEGPQFPCLDGGQNQVNIGAVSLRQFARGRKHGHRSPLAGTGPAHQKTALGAVIEEWNQVNMLGAMNSVVGQVLFDRFALVAHGARHAHERQDAPLMSPNLQSGDWDSKHPGDLGF
jgi:hypothetical protein